jgi:hypothetical protein
MHSGICKLRHRIAIVVCCALVLAAPFQHAHSQSKAAAKSPLCTRDNALEMIKQQSEISKTFNDPTRRITVLIRAADLLWPHQQDKARLLFTEAFDLAIEKEKEVEQKGSRSIILRMQTQDQRFVVITAVAKRDSAWAKELTLQLLKTVNDSDVASSRSSFENTLSANRLLDSARKLISIDTNGAYELFRASLNYPASSALTRFLYRLAEVNQPAADQFYAQALAVYADKPMGEFLYLQAYPFAWHEILNTPIFSFYEVPPNFVTNQSLQRQFVVAMLRRAQQALETQSDEADVYQNAYAHRLPGKVHLLHGLIKVESQVNATLPDLSGPLTQTRERLLVSLPLETQKLVPPARDTADKPAKNFDEQLELALKEPDLNERDGLIATAVMVAAPGTASVADVIRGIDKISDSSVRNSFQEWFYFVRAGSAIRDRDFDAAEKLASKVEGLEQRAYLHTELAKGLLNRTTTQTHGREVLEQAITEAKKIGVSIFAARTFLTASHLYARIDLSRSVEVLADAVNAVNRIEAPDFVSDDQSIEKTPERKSRGGRYGGEYELRFYMPGLDPESAFREMAKFDLDTALSQSSGLTDKFQRAMSTLGVVEVCLQQAQSPPKEKPKKK